MNAFSVGAYPRWVPREPWSTTLSFHTCLPNMGTPSASVGGGSMAPAVGAGVPPLGAPPVVANAGETAASAVRFDDDDDDPDASLPCRSSTGERRGGATPERAGTLGQRRRSREGGRGGGGAGGSRASGRRASARRRSGEPCNGEKRSCPEVPKLELA